MRVNRLLILVVAAAVLAVVPASPARAAGAVRSGSIVSGTGESPVSPWVRGMEGCVGAATCSAWLQSGCHPALAGQNPGVHASIVDVGTLAGTERVLTVRGGIPINWGDFMVQFWTPTEALGSAGVWCAEILRSRLTSWECTRYPFHHPFRCTFRIPSDARWMTISSSPDNVNLNWALR